MNPKLCSFIVLFWILLGNFALVNRAYACSGGGSDYIEALLQRTEIVVRAKPVLTDDVNQNGILQVDAYMYGDTASEFIMFVQLEPSVTQREQMGYAYGECDFFGPSLMLGETGYFFLERRPDGAYVSTTNWIDPNYYVFSEANPTVQISSSSDGENFVEHTLNQSQFEQFILSYGQSEMTSPQTASYPRTAPLRIRTTGNDYLLPVDTDIPVPLTQELIQEMSLATLGYDSPLWNERYFNTSNCPGADCVQISPNGLNRAWQTGNQVMWFGGSATGNAFLFASTSDAIAIWHENELNIYSLGFRIAGQRISLDSSDPSTPTLLHSVLLQDDTLTIPFEATWSPDGRILAFSDSEGLWLLDIYATGSVPHLLMAADNSTIPVAKQFSSAGRYLLVDRGNQNVTLDLETGALFPDGMVSPDERLLLAYNTEAAASFTIEICYLAPAVGCEPIGGIFRPNMDENPQYYDHFIQVVWRDRYSFWVAACEQDNIDNCMVDMMFDYQGSFWQNTGIYYPGRVFAYEPVGNYLATALDKTVQINELQYDFSRQLEGEITGLEWLSPLLYIEPG